MLLNFTNHPTTQWSNRQLEVAKEVYGNVEDLPFPHVDPNLDEMAVDTLSNEYLNIIQKRKPKAVHIMGELTFCMSMIKKLQHAGISCIASTTHRSTVDLPDGTKQVKFEFVRFRDY